MAANLLIAVAEITHSLADTCNEVLLYVGLRHGARPAGSCARTEGTDHLLAAGRAIGIRRFIAQSVVAVGTYVRTGGPEALLT